MFRIVRIGVLIVAQDNKSKVDFTRCIRENCIRQNCITRDGLGGGKSQIVRTPLRVKHDSVGKPEWIFFSLKSPIDFTVF